MWALLYKLLRCYFHKICHASKHSTFTLARALLHINHVSETQISLLWKCRKNLIINMLYKILPFNKPIYTLIIRDKSTEKQN